MNTGLHWDTVRGKDRVVVVVDVVVVAVSVVDVVVEVALDEVDVDELVVDDVLVDAAAPPLPPAPPQALAMQATAQAIASEWNVVLRMMYSPKMERR